MPRILWRSSILYFWIVCRYVCIGLYFWKGVVVFVWLNMLCEMKSDVSDRVALMRNRTSWPLGALSTDWTKSYPIFRFLAKISLFVNIIDMWGSERIIMNVWLSQVLPDACNGVKRSCQDVSMYGLKSWFVTGLFFF